MVIPVFHQVELPRPLISGCLGRNRTSASWFRAMRAAITLRGNKLVACGGVKPPSASKGRSDVELTREKVVGVDGVEPSFQPYQGCVLTVLLHAVVVAAGIEPALGFRPLRIRQVPGPLGYATKFGVPRGN
jgi:hypothetical protein